MSKELEQYLLDVELVKEFYETFSFSLEKIPADGGWSASQSLAHLADAEISLSLRARMILTTENYQFASWDEDAFAAIKEDREAKRSVEAFQALRLSNHDLFSTLSPEALLRQGIKANGEPISLKDYIAQMSRHVQAHLEQAVAAAK
jgi:hypothetical protein